ncbi:MAG: proline racemase family protein [Planctomycetota bacterium]
MASVFNRIQTSGSYDAPTNWLRFRTIDMHTAGEPLRVIVEGIPDLSGNTILQMRDEMHRNHDHLRQLLMFEPRGHADMYGLIPVPPERPDSHFGVLFTHNEGYSTMCGHATIAIARLAVELGWVEKVEPVTEVLIDAPCGQLKAFVQVSSGRAGEVSFLNVPSFVVAFDECVEVAGLGNVYYDLAYGGAFYAYVDADQFGLDLTSSGYSQLIRFGRDIKRAVIDQKSNVVHPFEPELSFLYGTIFVGAAMEPGSHSRNVCVFADGEVDRSPTGSGVSGRAAIHHSRGELSVGQEIVVESILGSRMSVSVAGATTFGPHQAVVPMVKGIAQVTGQHEFFLDPDDPFPRGFILR